MIFGIKKLCETFSVVLYMDGKTIKPETIEKLLRQAAEGAEQEIDEYTLKAEVMYVIFADFDHLLGLHLGYELEDEGFAMSWADDLPSYRKFARKMSEVIVGFISEVSEEFKQSNGYGLGEVIMKSLNDKTTPEIASAELEAEHQKLTFH